MPKFHFHLHQPSGVLRDSEGAEFAPVELAYRHAIAIAREIIAEDVKQGSLRLDYEIAVHDTAGTPVSRVPFVNAIAMHEGC